ncbi:MAG TPA: sodium:solute symporter family protein [Candidatus Nesterenkonia stercoripullorum]|uniref:Sodium:solute symporter family protein n=1 Tax=Candidatus Nesterenkonia stercoripullorum TaxID=2838701 RepID=A0A9D1S1S4_9MICC|nr:sodium:solute symporter family protein [Candidatus Nesterenkonia stercoripullorum]
MNWHLVWIIGFLVLLFVVSLVATRTVKTADNYIMGDFKMGFFPICGSIIATVTGSAALIGGAAQGFNLGISYSITVISFVGFTIVSMLLLGPIIRRLKLYTLPDLFARRFGKASALLPALIIAFMYMTPTFGMQLVGMASILSSITELPYIWGILLGFVVIIAFTMIGGLPSVAWTDAIQTVVILAGVALTFIFGIIYVGGPTEFVRSAPSDLLSFGSIGTTEMLNWFLVFGPFYIVWQTTWQRITAARSVKTGMSAVIVGFIISGIIGVMAILIGIAGVQVFPAETNPDSVYTMFIVDLFPDWFGGLLMVSLLAALLTGATSFLLSGAINISKDIYQGWVNPQADDERILKVSRLSVAAMAFLGLLIALLIEDIIAIYQVALSFTAASLVMPVMAAMFWRRATKAGVIVSIVGAVAAALLWRIAGQPLGIHEIGPGLVVSAVLLVAVSLGTAHSPDEKVTAYFHDRKRLGSENPEDVTAGAS